MKRKLFLLLCALLTMISARATITSGSDYLIKNVETGYYLVGGMDWGTHACLHQMPQWFTLSGSGTSYSLDSHQFNGANSHFLGTGLFVDAGTTNWEVVETATSGVYTISNNGNYIAGNGVNAAITTTTDGNASAAKWQLINKNEYISSLFSATAGSGVDATPYIRDPELKRNGNYITWSTKPWTIKSFDGSANPGNFAEGQNGNNASCSESYHSNNGFKATQTLKGLIPGTYKLSAQAFYRQDGSDNDHYPYLFVQVNSGSVLTSNFPVLSGSENNMVQAYASFLTNSYPVTPIEFTVTSVDDEIKIGYACENTGMWCIFGETKLTYYGEMEDDSDVTGFISNPSFETGNLNGWVNSDMGTQNNAAFSLKDGTYYAERWHSAGDKGVSQELLLPEGLYVLTAAINPSNMGATLSIGGQSVTAPANAAEADYSVYFDSNGTTLSTINLTANCKDDSWLCVDNFRLKYNPALTAAVGKMNAAVSAAQDAAISEYNSNPSLTTFTAAGAAIDAARESIGIYTQIAAINAKAALLDAAGIAAYASTLSAYNDGTLTTVAEAQTAYIAAVKSQTSIGSDWTGAISNPDFSTNDLSGWTINTSSGYSSPTVDTGNKDCEFYEKKFDMSQTLTGMKKGTYEISFQAFQRPGVNSDALLEAYKTGEWTSLATLKTSAERTAVPNIYSADRTSAIFPGTGETWPYDLSATYNETKYYVPNSMEGARKWFDTEVGSTGVNYYTTTARAICTENGGDMYFGFEGDLTGTGQAWLIFANFQLKYIDTDVLVDPTASEALIAEATTLAARVMNSGVRDDLQDAIDALTAEKTSGDLYAALEAEMVTATASADNYAQLATAIDNAENYVDYKPQFPSSATAYEAAIATAQDVYDTESVTDCTAAITALTNAVHAANVSDYTIFTEDYEYSYATLLNEDMREWATSDWGMMTGNEHWNGQNSQNYYEQTSDEWGQSSWSHNGTETVTLPAGNYVMSIIARASAPVTSTMSVTIGDSDPITTVLTHKGSTGKGVTTAGVASFDEGTFANTNGRGWEYRFVAFTVAEDNTDVTISVSASASQTYQWVSLTNPLLRGDVHPNQVILNQINTLLTTLEGYESSITSALYATFSDDIADAEAATVDDETSELEAIVTALTADIAAASAQATINNTVITNKGDITSLINGNFTDNADGWTGGQHKTGMARNWRNGSDQNPFYERTTDGTMSYTISNMPAGTYKVVAAWRSITDGEMTPAIAGTSGTKVTGVGDAAADDGHTEINTNGVEMPYSTLGGFTTNDLGHNWKWITATGTLATDGNLVLSFTTSGTEGWNAIDDVHLYCTHSGFNDTDYTQTLSTVSGNTSVTNTGDKSVVTCDIVMSNPNAIISSSAAINGAAGTQLNNNIVSGTIANLVLYDGSDFTAPDGSYAATVATLYRSIAANKWISLVLPFVPTTEFSAKKAPSELSDDVLTFADATPANDAPMMVKNTSDISVVTGTRENGSTGDLTNGEGAPMQGVYSNGTVPVSSASANNYVISSNNLYKVNSEVNIKPFRAYFTVEGGSNARIVLNFDEDVTAINAIEAAESKAEGLKDGKYLENGKIVIVKNGVKYGANGQKLN